MLGVFAAALILSMAFLKFRGAPGDDADVGASAREDACCVEASALGSARQENSVRVQMSFQSLLSLNLPDP